MKTETDKHESKNWVLRFATISKSPEYRLGVSLTVDNKILSLPRKKAVALWNEYVSDATEMFMSALVGEKK